MSTSKNTRKLTAVPAPSAPDIAQDVERAAYRAAALTSVLHELLLQNNCEDRLRIPPAVLADYVECVDRELDFVTTWIGSMHVHEGVAAAHAQERAS